MKINEVTGTQATLSAYQPGKMASFTMPDGTVITKDLTKNPNLFATDTAGKMTANLMTNPTAAGQPTGQQPGQQPLTVGTKLDVNLNPSEDMENIEEVDDESVEIDSIKKLSGL
jgi:hypothetical protein